MAEQYIFNPITTGSNSVMGMIDAFSKGKEISDRGRQLDQADTRLSLAKREVAIGEAKGIREQEEYDYGVKERARIIAEERQNKIDMNKLDSEGSFAVPPVDMSDEDFAKLSKHTTPDLIKNIYARDPKLAERLRLAYKDKSIKGVLDGFNKKAPEVIRLGNEWNLNSLDPRLGQGSQNYTSPQDRWVGGTGRGSFGSKQNIGHGLTGNSLKMHTFTKSIMNLPERERSIAVLANTFTEDQLIRMDQLYQSDPKSFSSIVDKFVEGGISNKTFINESNNPSKIIRDAINSKFKVKDNSDIEEASNILKEHMDKVESYKSGKNYKFGSVRVGKPKDIKGKMTTTYKVPKGSAEEYFNSPISANFERRNESIVAATGSTYKNIYNAWKDKTITRAEAITGIDNNSGLINELTKGTELTPLDVKQIMISLAAIESSDGSNNTNLSLLRQENGDEYMGMAVGHLGITVGNFSDGVKNWVKQYADLATIDGVTSAGIQDLLLKYKSISKKNPTMTKAAKIQAAVKRYGENTDEYLSKFNEVHKRTKGTVASATDIQDIRNMFA